MYRRLGLLPAFCFLVVTAGNALASDLSQPRTVSLEAASAAADSAKTEPKKEKKEREYAAYLHRKLNKGPQERGPEPKYKPWNKVITGEHKRSDGLLTVYTKQEEMLLVLKKDQLDKPYLAILSLSQGIGSDFVYGGLPVDDIMFDFHRDEDHIQLRRLSSNFRAPGNEPLERAIALTFSNSILESFPIKSEKGDMVVIDVRDFFLSDVAGMSNWLGGALDQPVRPDAKKNYLASFKNFPENTEIDTRLNYSPGRIEALHLPNVPDPRNIQVGVAWSIRKLPENPMMPRLADDRVGYFTTDFKDFTKEGSESFFTHYANRWRLEKKDPSAALSEPVKPITFYIDRTVPEQYVPYMIKGVELWNRAFEAAGFKNAIVAKKAPTPEEDPNYDPVDARYNTIRWNTSDQVSYGAIGPSRVDPRTGEIIDADILFEHQIVANFGKAYRRYAGPQAALMQVDPTLKQLWMTPEERQREDAIRSLPYFRNHPMQLCSMDNCMELGGQFLRVALLGAGLVDPAGGVPEEFVGEALTFVAAHEVGHTLGFRHNFMSSSSTPYDQLNNKSRIDEIGMTGSVMDYPTPNVARDTSKQGYYYTPTVGTCDVWAAKWGYTPVDGDTPEAQAKNLEPIAEQCTAKEHWYGTDEDTYPINALDPRSNINDLSDNPMLWATERMGICDDLLKNGKLEDRVVAEDGDYVPLRAAVTTLLMQKYVCSIVAAKNIGGAVTSRAHKGSDAVPFQPISAADQRRALGFVVDNALKTDGWALSPHLLNKMQDDKMWSWENNPFQAGRRFDFPLTNWVDAIQTAALFNLLNPFRQARVVEAQYQSDDSFQLSEMYSALTKSIWTGNAIPSGRTAVWQRNLQRTYTDMLIQQVVSPFPVTPQDAVALSRLNLSRIRGAAQSNLSKSGLDDATNAHLMETIARIDRALDASRQTNF